MNNRATNDIFLFDIFATKFNYNLLMSSLILISLWFGKLKQLHKNIEMSTKNEFIDIPKVFRNARLLFRKNHFNSWYEKI